MKTANVLAPVMIALLATACATTAQGTAPGLAALNETVFVDGPRVTPLAVLEDSRCPQNARCIWAGRVRIQARVDLGSRTLVREMTLGEPIAVADGTLALVTVLPERTTAEGAPRPADYRFGFEFDGGY